jgi:type IV secretion system protein VirD4
MRLFDAPTIRNLTSSTSFDIADLIDGKPMSLYFVVPPFRLQAYAPVIRLWLSALMAAFSTRPVDHRRKTLLLIDEIGNLGRMDEFVTAATLMRGWGVTLWSFWQSFSQLHQYGHNAQVLADNAGVIQLFSPRNYRTAKEFCDLVGGITPEAVMALRPDEQLLLIEGGQPRVARKVQYFRDPEFSRLVTANNAVR